MDSREARIEKFEARLDEVRAEIDRLKARAKKADAEARIRLDEEIAALEARREVARERLRELREASDAAWSDLVAGVERSWRELGDAVRSAASRFG